MKTKQSKIKIGINFFDDVFVPNVLSEYCPGLDFTQSFNSTNMETGEYVIDTGTASDGNTTIYCEVCFPPEVYDRIMQQSYEKIESLFNKSVKANIDKVATDVLSNTDDLTITFQITVY